MTERHARNGSWHGNAPVFELKVDDTHGGTSGAYPSVWISVQRDEPTENATGRDRIGLYTPAGDADGDQAMHYGGRYYTEGMSCDGETEHERRIMCFQAAELLYLHAASKGNPFGHLCLGYVYSYDRCEGAYFENTMAQDHRDAQDIDCDRPRPYPHLERAHEHYRAAAEAGIAEACYKLGDMLRDGRGCDIDLVEAYGWFSRAYELGVRESPVVWGSAALRIAHALEEGEGCEQSFAEAERWYQRASTGLGIAVRGGERWYRGSLRHAERGLKRVAQELSGAY